MPTDFSDTYYQFRIGAGSRLGSDSEQLVARKIIEDGWCFLPSVLTFDEADMLRDAVEWIWHNIRPINSSENDFIRRDVSAMRVFEHSAAFRDLIVREPVISIVEQILGLECHLIAQNCLRTGRGQNIGRWHVDDELFFPISMTDQALWDARTLPVYSLSVMYLFTDVETISDGPTQIIPRSHLSGHTPMYGQELDHQAEVVSVTGSKGDAYVFNSQVWHRGAPNLTGRKRFVATSTYGRRFLSQRFYPFLNYKMPSIVTQGASERLIRVLGAHGKGPYG